MIELSICACGSGLRRLRCCGFDLRLASPPAAYAPLSAMLARAREERQRGNHAEAARICREILELAPAWTETLSLLAGLIHGLQPRVAELLLQRVVSIEPNDFVATVELARLLLARGALIEAEAQARNAIRLAPENAQAHNLLAMTLTQSNRARVGEFHFRRVIALSGFEDATLLSNLGWSLKEQGKIAEARELYQKLLARTPDHIHALLNAARVEEVDRQFAAAEALLDRVEKIAPDNVGLALTRAVCAARTGRPSEALKILERLESRSDRGALDAVQLSEKGRILDSMQRYDEAWAGFVAGKQRLRDNGGHVYLDEQAANLYQRLGAFFTAKRLATLPRANRASGPQPIFIIGFPRSGTTLVEQSLTRHPRIAAGDELPFIHDIAHSMPRLLDSRMNYPEALAELWMGDQQGALDRLRDIYLQRAREQGVITPDCAWFTDKMPLNETHLGLIALLFPESPIIHLIRHPLDVVVSVFSNHLSHGFHCASALETIAKHFQRTADLVARYRSEMPLRYLPLRYEDLVQAQEQTLRRAFEFIGEDFDPRTLVFHENTRYARTASYAQVTEPMYERSVYRYQHYLKGLAPVIPMLEATISRLGYNVDRSASGSGALVV